LKTGSDGAAVTFGGRAFHTLDAATPKARSPMTAVTLFYLSPSVELYVSLH